MVQSLAPLVLDHFTHRRGEEGRGTIWINAVKDYLAMLHTKFEAPESSGPEKTFLNIFMYFYGSNSVLLR